MPRRGENIYKRKDGRWEGRYIKGHSGGKTQYGYVYARTYAEAKRKLSEQATVESPPNKAFKQLNNQKGRPTFEEISLEWIASVEPQIKESTYVKYMNSLKLYLNPAFSSQAVEAISRSDVSTLCLSARIRCSISIRMLLTLRLHPKHIRSGPLNRRADALVVLIICRFLQMRMSLRLLFLEIL